MYVWDNVVSAKCFSGECNFWKVFFGEVYRIRVPLPLRSFLSNVKNLNVVHFLVKHTTKSECLIDHHLQRNIFKACSSFKSRVAPTPLNSKMNHFANQLIFKIRSRQKFSILVLTEALLRMVAPGAGFRGGTLYRQKIGENQKKKKKKEKRKRSSLQNELVFGPKVCDDQKKRSLPTNPWVFGLKRK